MKRRFFLKSMAALAALPALSFPNVTVKLDPDTPDIYELFLDAINSVGPPELRAHRKPHRIEVSRKVMNVLHSLLEDIQIRSFGPVRVVRKKGVFIKVVSYEQGGIQLSRTFTDEDDPDIRLKTKKPRTPAKVVMADDETLRRLFSGELS